jgi:hypothetical protein
MWADVGTVSACTLHTRARHVHRYRIAAHICPPAHIWGERNRHAANRMLPAFPTGGLGRRAEGATEAENQNRGISPAAGG